MASDSLTHSPTVTPRASAASYAASRMAASAVSAAAAEPHAGSCGAAGAARRDLRPVWSPAPAKVATACSAATRVPVGTRRPPRPRRTSRERIATRSCFAPAHSAATAVADSARDVTAAHAASPSSSSPSPCTARARSDASASNSASPPDACGNEPRAVLAADAMKSAPISCARARATGGGGRFRFRFRRAPPSTDDAARGASRRIAPARPRISASSPTRSPRRPWWPSTRAGRRRWRPRVLKARVSAGVAGAGAGGNRRGERVSSRPTPRVSRSARTRRRASRPGRRSTRSRRKPRGARARRRRRRPSLRRRAASTRLVKHPAESRQVRLAAAAAARPSCVHASWRTRGESACMPARA